MEQNGKQVESVGEYLCGIYDNRVKRKEAVTLADLCYAWEKRKEHSVDSESAVKGLKCMEYRSG